MKRTLVISYLSFLGKEIGTRKSYYSTQKVEGFNKNKSITVKDKILGRNKHYTPANKEWKDSVYSFTPNYIKSIVPRHSLANRLIRSQLSLHGLKNIARSRRMRMKMIRFSTRKLIVSNPEIKHNNDKVNITVYVFNREKQFYTRKLFFYKRKQRLYNSWITTGLHLGKKVKYTNLIKKRKSVFKLDLNRFKKKNIKRHIPYYGIKFRNERDFLRYKLSHISKKLTLLDKFYNYSFINYLKNLLTLDSSTFSPIKKEKFVNETSNLLMLNNQMSFWGLQSIITSLVNKGVISYSEVTYLYNTFLKEKYKEIRSILLKRGSKVLHLQSKLQVNQLKLGKLVSGLKALITRVYEKKTDLNIVNLKYLHLNSDIYTQAIALKLRKKKNLLRVMKKSFALVKLPKAFFFRKEKLSLNEYVDLNIHKNLQLDKLPLNTKQGIKITTKDKLNTRFERVFPYNLVNNSLTNINMLKQKVKAEQILDSLKFKWISGLRLEVAGRLTRRYKAARAVFKFKYKGNLKSKQYYMELGVLKTMPTTMLRKDNKVNTQYSFIKSKRRIGSFGIKNWISQY